MTVKTADQQRLEEMLTKIVNRATRPRPDGDTGYFLQSVRSGLIDEARSLLKELGQ